MPTTGLYNLVQIGSIYLTSDGTSSGTPCKTTDYRGLDALKLTKTGNIQLAIDKTPFLQIISNSMKGELVSFVINEITTSVYNSIIAAHQSALDNKTTISLTITGDTGTFNLTVYPSLGSKNGQFPPSIQFPGTFINGRVKSVTLSYVTT